jgi:16S rRNA (cytosine967-C5)-methyltransferase
LLRLVKAGVDSTASNLSPWAITLAKPCSVLKVPGFSDGLVSVQDAAAQLSPCFLGPLQGLRVLDACAAPGGKTGQLYELATDTTSITAIDLPGRTNLIRENIQRLKGHVDIVCGDVTEPDRWWDGKPYDRIILDAPCSGSGVIRRHPDIRVLRRHTDIPRFSRNQLNMIQQLWPLLRRGGCLLYITCSILPAENDAVIGLLLENTKDASSVPTDHSLGKSTRFGRQFLPCPEGDGLYYAIVQKC